MYWSAGLAALVPAGVVTVTSTVPVPAGAIAVSEVALETTTLAPVLAPNLTLVVLAAKLVPVMVTVMPPALDPEDGLTFVTVGGP